MYAILQQYSERLIEILREIGVLPRTTEYGIQLTPVPNSKLKTAHQWE